MRLCHPVSLMALALTLTACTTIEPGNVGVMTDEWNGDVVKEPLRAGYHYVGMYKKVYEFPSGVVSNINMDNFRVNTREGQEITIDVRVQYRPDLTPEDDHAVQLFQRYRKPFEGDNGLVQTRWIPVIQQAAGYAVSQYGVIDIYQSRGAKAAALMSRILQNGLKTKDVQIDGIGDDFVTIQTVAISDIVLPEAIKTAVERKAQIEQETMSAKQGLEKARMAAEQVKIEARAEAEAKVIRAQGEARARAALGINPEQYVRLETAKMTADAIKSAPNLVIVPSNSILDTRSLGLPGAPKRGE
ncbi:MAG: SPFH domain-containing protein [Candidatus Sericytochromatia bacterium]|nr:SPFH domain-containing protein [Candidatus Sericytochromatia bacterium]